MRFNRKTFWTGFRAQFSNLITQEQVDGLEFLLSVFERDVIWKDIRHISYALATIAIETAYTYQPIQEIGTTGYFERRYGYQTKKGRELGNDAPGEGAKYSGKGYVQLTGETNYEEMEEIIRRQNPETVAEFEKRTGQRFDLTDYVNQAKDPQIAFLIMTIGMFRGTFTGKAFSDYINNQKTDYVNARRIINGTDKANMIAGFAMKFEKILRESENKTFENPVQPSEIEFNEPTAPASEGVPPAKLDSTESTVNHATTEGEADPVNRASSSPPTQGKGRTNNNAPPDKVAVEKPKPKGFFSRIWKEITGLFGGSAITDVGTEKLAQIQAFGLSADFWKRLFWIFIFAAIVYLIIRFFQYRQEDKRELEITNKLIEENSTATNKVVLVDAENIEEFKQRGYAIVYR